MISGSHVYIPQSPVAFILNWIFQWNTGNQRHRNAMPRRTSMLDILQAVQDPQQV